MLEDAYQDCHVISRCWYQIGPHIIPGIASSDVARGPVPTPGNIRHLLTCSALSSHYAPWVPDSCLSNVSPPWDSNTSSGNPFHDIITLLMRCCCYLLLLLRAHCKSLQCYSAHSACYSVLAVLELFYVFSKVSCFMLILMNIKNKLKCENNYLIRDQNNFSFIAEIVEFYVLKPGDKHPI